MSSSPTPFERLIRLEHQIGQLQFQISSPPPPPPPITVTKPERHVWPADELLLTRLIRRNPEALEAYQSAAELTKSEGQGILATAISGASPFRLCELQSGDAVVWISPEHESWLYKSEIFRSVFKVPTKPETDKLLVLQTLPRFIRKVQGREWTLEQQGEMIPQGRPFVTQREQAELEQRIQRLEQTIARMRGSYEAELDSLKSAVQLISDHLGRLSRLQPSDNPVTGE